MINMILAADKHGCIGNDNKLCWHIPDDLRRFKMLTNNGVIIMGRKTFESLPKVLPNRISIVITRSENYDVPEGVIVVNSIEESIKKAKEISERVFIIGGATIYKESIDFVDVIYWTEVDTEVEGDAFVDKSLLNGFDEKEAMVVKGPINCVYKKYTRNVEITKQKND